MEKNLATKELKQVWSSADVAAIAVATLEQRKRRFRARYLLDCDLEFPKLEDVRPRPSVALTLNYKRCTHHKKKGGRNQIVLTERKTRKKTNSRRRSKLAPVTIQ